MDSSDTEYFEVHKSKIVLIDVRPDFNRDYLDKNKSGQKDKKGY